MSYRDFFKPQKPKATQAHAKIAAGLVRTDERWLGPRPRPLFNDLTEGEIDISLALLHGRDEFPPR